MAIEVRLLKRDELKLANDFFNKIYRSNRTYAHFKWEFIDCPAGESIYVAAIDTALVNEIKIVGIQCAIPLYMIDSAGEKILTAKSEDTLVDPDYRGQDIFNKMYQLLFDSCRQAGIKYIWGFTPAYKPFVKLGFELDFKSSQLLYVHQPIAAYRYLSGLNPKNKLIDKGKILALSLLSKIHTFKRSKFNAHEFTCEQGRFQFANVYAQGPCTSGSLYLFQDEAYMHWRIFNNAHHNQYKHLIFKNKKGEKVADVIINVRSAVGYIEQLVFAKNLQAQQQRAIINESIKKLIDSGVALIRFLGFEANEINRAEVKLLLEVGFYQVHRGNWFVWKSLDERYNQESTKVVLNRLYTQGVM